MTPRSPRLLVGFEKKTFLLVSLIRLLFIDYVERRGIRDQRGDWLILKHRAPQRHSRRSTEGVGLFSEGLCASLCVLGVLGG